MNNLSPAQTKGVLLGALALMTPAGAAAQQEAREDIIVSGQQDTPYAEPELDLAAAPAGPEIEGIISARDASRLQITSDDGNRTVIALNDATRIKASKGFLGLGRKRWPPMRCSTVCRSRSRPCKPAANWSRARSACATAISRPPI
jgi:hypothetical protein